MDLLFETMWRFVNIFHAWINVFPEESLPLHRFVPACFINALLSWPTGSAASGRPLHHKKQLTASGAMEPSVSAQERFRNG